MNRTSSISPNFRYLVKILFFTSLICILSDPFGRFYMHCHGIQILNISLLVRTYFDSIRHICLQVKLSFQITIKYLPLDVSNLQSIYSKSLLLVLIGCASCTLYIEMHESNETCADLEFMRQFPIMLSTFLHLQPS